MAITELNVAGMTCGSCVASVTRSLKRVPGVEDVQVDLSNGTARVTGEEVAERVATLLTALADAGYEASLRAPAAATADGAAATSCQSMATGTTKGHGGCCCH